jgi:GT2 family glycosyltransferase
VEVKETTHCGGVLRMMRTELVRKVGGWPDEDTTRGHEEIYICGKLREMGYKVGYFVDMFAWHQFGDDDNWGYGGISLSEHGHNPIQPGSSFYDKIKCDPKTWRPL